MTTLTTGRPGSGSSARKGFTMLELVLVMLIACTVLAMAAPALRGFFASRRTDDAGAQVLSLVQFARSQAAAEGRVYRLNLELREGAYWLTAQTGTSFDRLGTEFGRTFTLPQGTVAELQAAETALDRSYVSFYPTGLTEASVIRLTGAQGRVVEVACQSPTESFVLSAHAMGDSR